MPEPSHPSAAQAFLKAVACGTLAGAAPMLLVTVPLAVAGLVSDGGFKDGGFVVDSLYLATLPIMVSFVIVFISSVVVGIPAALMLRRLQLESKAIYTFAGGLAGLLIALPFTYWGTPDWMCLLAFFSGAVTALVWWRNISKQTTTHL